MDRQEAMRQITSKRANLIALAYEMYGYKFGSLALIGKPRIEVGSELGMLIAAIKRSQVVELYQHPATREWMIELNTEGERPIARLTGWVILVGEDAWARCMPKIAAFAYVPQWNGFGYGDDVE